MELDLRNLFLYIRQNVAGELEYVSKGNEPFDVFIYLYFFLLTHSRCTPCNDSSLVKLRALSRDAAQP